MKKTGKSDNERTPDNYDLVTDWGETVKVVYSPEDVNRYLELPTAIGNPGEYPYVRGIHSNMYKGQPWSMRQYSGFGSAEETNLRFKYLLDQGQTGLSVAFDLPTQIGYDSDDPMSEGEVGRVGVPVDCLLDMEEMFSGLPLDQLSTSMTINAPAAILLAMYIVVAEKSGVATKNIRGTIQNDILKEYTVRGTYIFPVKPSIRLIKDTVEYCSKFVPKFNAVNVAGYHYREAGCSAVQEIAFSFSNAIQYIETCLSVGLDVDEFAPRISWIFNTSNKVFEEAAKYRAARKVWADIMKNRFNAKKNKSMLLRFHTHTSGVSLTSQQPENNIVRVAYQVLAAVLGGAQSIAACSYDEAHSLPSEDAAKLSLRTQQIVYHESGVADTVDPLGGSYYVEALTQSMVEKITAVIAEIDAMGGAMKAIESGYIQNEIDQRAFEYQKDVEEGRRIVVGVNKYQDGQPPSMDMHTYNRENVRKQLDRLAELKKNRDSMQVKASLAEVKRVAESEENIMPSLISAVKAYATIGEICHVLKGVFGEYRGS